MVGVVGGSLTAQRVPVRIHLDQVPQDVLLAAGMTCTVIVRPVDGIRSTNPTFQATG
ncbi:hypothetical protein JHZ65_21910 [Pseudomonas syringae pv. maculicola]|nr:hypothetical protein [Pseudomonas syringae group genomosp. 3]QQN30335.1 hypothetical protein JHZ65_21910 [Pseudomonas syringae pv. maculicola]